MYITDLIERAGKGILTGDEIARQVAKGRIHISEFDPANLNPNSYNLHTGNTVTVYNIRDHIDLKDPDTFKDTTTFDLTSDGFMMRPGNTYLIPTRESIGSPCYEPIFTGRSSIGRLGISVHQEAGFADIGYHGQLTMQFKVTYPTKIYPNLAL